ncbi:periphilin-1 isoform X2 [Salmo salar]|uniref:Periphilin-1 isoform X2 n=1 Tax=Salmo salar TaxID=8030 RepID=A0A1S3MC94_SALSA|nr:periphilin-1 isoform X2 [Salmo salar]|eukprot:XP_014000823.1 PREDICTED: periphilin-1 isoform X2 [Salmo salar]
MDPRQQESSQGKSSTILHKERSEESRDKRPSDVPIKHNIEEAKQPFRRMRSPPRPRITGSFRPRFGGRFFRPRFIRDDHSFRKPRFSFGFQRYHPFTPRPRFNWRDQSGPPQGPPCPNNQYNDQRNMDRSGPARASTPKEHSSALRSSAGPSREKEKQPVSFIELEGQREHRCSIKNEKVGVIGWSDLERSGAQGRGCLQFMLIIQIVWLPANLDEREREMQF